LTPEVTAPCHVEAQSCDAFVAEVRKVRGKKRPLSAAILKNLRDERSTAPPRMPFGPVN